MNIADKIDTAMNQIKPDLTQRYMDMAERMFNAQIEQYGPKLAGMKNLADFYNVVQSACKTDQNREHYLDKDELLKIADRNSDAIIKKWSAKIIAKVEDLDDVTVTRMGGAEFSITGTRMGYDVVISQQMIIKCSSNGKVFNQFPSRIYVDGKFKSEADYKKMFSLITTPKPAKAKKEKKVDDNTSTEQKSTATKPEPTKSKMDVAKEVMAEMKGQQRKDIIAEMIKRAGLTKAGASTYYQKLK